MGAPEFGQLVDRAITSRRMSQARLAVLIGELPDGGVLNETQVRRIREGERRLTRSLVERLIDVLGLDWAEAWAASGLLPTHVTADDLRQLEQMRQRPLEPVLTHARGGQQPPTAFSLRTTRPTPHQQRRDTSCSRVVAGHRLHRRAWRPIAPDFAKAA